MAAKVQAKPTVLTVAEQVAYAANPLLGLIVEYTGKAVAKSADIAESGEIDALRQEAQVKKCHFDSRRAKRGSRRRLR